MFEPLTLVAFPDSFYNICPPHDCQVVDQFPDSWFWMVDSQKVKQPLCWIAGVARLKTHKITPYYA